MSLTAPRNALARTLEQDARGRPLHYGREIPRSSYVAVKAKPLANPKVLWVNTEFMKQNGYSLNHQDILREWAWSVPAVDDPADLFLEGEKIFYATRYGGSGLGGNQGDGRAAGAGRFQIKGIGKTPLVKIVGLDHSNGKVPFPTGFREAFWGEINHRELPYGGNRVVALIDRGTTTVQPNGVITRDVLIVREDPVRPAHSMELRVSLANTGETQIREISTQSLSALARALPKANSSKGGTTKEKILEGFSEFIRRLAHQHATAFAKQLYHGSTSESNIEISGRFLDYDTQTAQPGHGKVQTFSVSDSAGETKYIKVALIDNFIGGILTKLTASKEKSDRLRKFNAQFDTQYQFYLRREFLKLIGYTDDILNTVGERQEAKDFADALIQVATVGAKKYLGRYDVPDQVTKYNFFEIAVALSNSKSTSVDDFAVGLRAAQLPTVVANRLARLHVAFLEKAIEVAPTNFRKSMPVRAKTLNRPRPEAYRWNAFKQTATLVERYLATGDESLIQREIDSTIARNLRAIPVETGPQRRSCENLFTSASQ